MEGRVLRIRRQDLHFGHGSHLFGHQMVLEQYTEGPLAMSNVGETQSCCVVVF